MNNSKIQWTDNTHNVWLGCTKVSPGCVNCYAEMLVDKRYKRVKWGKGKARVLTSESNRKKPESWNRKAWEIRKRIRVFCASLSDVFDPEVPDLWRDELFDLIERTPNLDWQLLTKRPEEAVRYAKTRVWPANAWIGVTVENQDAVHRARIIQEIPAPVRFLSVEPLLGPVELDLTGIGWVIVGGESGPGFREMKLEWARSVRDQCRAANVPLFFKQHSGMHPKKLGRKLDRKVWSQFPKTGRKRFVEPVKRQKAGQLTKSVRATRTAKSKNSAVLPAPTSQAESAHAE